MNEDAPIGRVHIDQRTGQPARWIGQPISSGDLPETAPASAFFDPDQWVPTSWDEMSRSEQKLYKRQYPVV